MRSSWASASSCPLTHHLDLAFGRAKTPSWGFHRLTIREETTRDGEACLRRPPSPGGWTRTALVPVVLPRSAASDLANSWASLSDSLLREISPPLE
eukprot:4753601-Pyramimonas_sp.AAC.1